LVYDVFRDGRPVDQLRLQVQGAADGTLCFASPGGQRLYFGKRNGTFFCYRLEGDEPNLALLLRALPRLPLCNRDGLTTADHLPASLLCEGRSLAGRLGRAAIQLGSAFLPGLERTDGLVRMVDRGIVRCRAAACWLPLSLAATATLDDAPGPATVLLGRWELRRVRFARGGASSS